MTYESLASRSLKCHEIFENDFVKKIIFNKQGVMKSLTKVINIFFNDVLNIFLCINTNLSARLGFESLPYPKSFMSFLLKKDYIHTVANNNKVLYKSFYILHIPWDMWYNLTPNGLATCGCKHQPVDYVKFIID